MTWSHLYRLLKFEFAFSCIPFLRFDALASQRRDRAWLIPRFRHFTRPFSKRRAWNLNIADVLSRANPLICNYGRKDFPNLVAYSNTHFMDINPWKSTWDYWKFTQTVKISLVHEWRELSGGRMIMSHGNITEPHEKYRLYCLVTLVPYC